MKLSKFGKKFTGESGASSLMEDLSSALNENPDMLFMGGGNPSRIPQMEEIFRQRLASVFADPDELHKVMGVYQSPQGDIVFLREIAALLKKEYGWNLSEKNIAISNGSQAAFFVLFNMFAGEFDGNSDGVTGKQIQLPLAPEYLGYADTGLGPEFFNAAKPNIEILDDHIFKYHVDFSRLHITDKTGAICVSRPTNPTGNVLSDEEVAHLDQLARQHDIPLILDGAYGTPFPNIIFTEATPLWNENTILLLSLSKLGLPGARTGVIVAREDIIKAYTNANAILSLACGNFGPAIAKALIESGEILSLSRNVVGPYYQERAMHAVDLCKQSMGDTPFFIHKPEGAIFLWLWFKDLPITSEELYERLKERGVLVVSGHHFFPGLSEEWQHKHECIRVNYAQDTSVVERGIAIIGEEVRKAYAV